MKKILISACLAGELTRYDAKQVPLTDPLLLRFHQKGCLVRVCPEISGGLDVPRPPAQILKGSGLDVLNRTARVMDIEGNDVTRPFISGAEYALSLAWENKIEMAILKEKSPSCGVRHIYDGSFTATLISGAGVTAALLKKNGIKVFSEKELDRAVAFWEKG